MNSINPATDSIASSVTPDETTYVEDGSGPLVVFVHGVGMNLRVWSPQMSEFADSFRVVAYDLLGHGGSPLPPDPTELRDLSDQLTRLLDHLGVERAHVVGHSMGALVALDFALRMPQRVSRLVALNAVYLRSADERASAVERARKFAEGKLDQSLEATIQRWFAPEQINSNPQAVRCVEHWLRSVDPRGYARIYNVFATADDAFVGRLGELACPALFATGELDPHSTPAMSCLMAEDSQEGRALVLEGKRHMMAFAEPEEINAHLYDFLRGEDAYQHSPREANGMTKIQCNV